jgi:ribosomal protein S18 acetylase RimI-like enzyme
VNESRTRSARITDIDTIATVHEAAFAGFFLARMGAGFLRAYYRLVMDYPGGLLLVSEDETGVDGFVSGFVDPAGFYGYMVHKRRHLLWPTLCAILRRPVLLPRALFNRRRIEAVVGTTEPDRCELSSIGVLPVTAGRGLGSALVEAFCEEAGRRGCRRVDLTTDAEDNDDVNAFYLRCGFVMERSFLSGGKRRMNGYVRHLVTGDAKPGDQPE